MSRLIDADALKMHKYHSTTTYENAVAVAYIDNAPTIPAIPVEWLEAHKTEYFEDWGEEPITVENALKMWQREQEAQK